MESADLECRHRPLNLALFAFKDREMSGRNASGALELLGQNTV
jgi:hypothetical protein